MRFTALLVDAPGRIFLLAGHVWRLGEESREPLVSFARTAEPGPWRVSWDGAHLETTRRRPTRLHEGIATRVLVSPFADQRGRFPKPGAPSAYDAVRAEGLATLLTGTDGRELFESCVASLVAWDGATLVLPPEDAPGVASVTEWTLSRRLPHRRAPLLVESDWPLLLINALVGTCAPDVPGRPQFPEDVRARIDAALRVAESAP